jgi:hypothetical protein
MTIPIRIRLGVGTALVSVACSGSGLTAVDENGDRIPLRIVSDFRQPDSTQTPVTIETASISGDTLHVRLSYGGGCGGPHEFGLAASGSLIESDPPQVMVILRHDGHGDPCRAGLGANVIADLRPLQGIAGDHTTLRVQLHEPWALAPVEPVLVYSFQASDVGGSSLLAQPPTSPVYGVAVAPRPHSTPAP